MKHIGGKEVKYYMAQDGRGWHGDSEGHARVGEKGGRSQGRENNPGNFANDREKAREAGKRGGSR